jgi:predicted nucleic acid-binding protein
LDQTVSWSLFRWKTKLNSINSKFVIDAYAWIEYFRGSEYGKVAKEFIESIGSVTPSIVIIEVGRKLQKETELGNETSDGRLTRLDFINATSQVVELDFELAAAAGKIIWEMNKKGGKVVTGDEHFRDLKEAIFIK